MPFRLFRLTVIVVFVLYETGSALYRRLQTDKCDRISYTAHIAGAVTGILLGIVILHNLKVTASLLICQLFHTFREKARFFTRNAVPIIFRTFSNWTHFWAYIVEAFNPAFELIFSLKSWLQKQVILWILLSIWELDILLHLLATASENWSCTTVFG